MKLSLSKAKTELNSILFITRLFFGAIGLKILRKSRQDKPWMALDELLLLKEILRFVEPKRCLEWGTGYSTIFFSSQLGPASQWNSIEHDKKWFLEIKCKLRQKKQISLVLVEPEHKPWTDSYNDGALSDLSSYVNYPKDRLMGSFDFILIDGRARRDCLDLSHDLLSEKGVVVLHDANRIFYFEGRTRTFPFEYKLLDNRNYGGFFIGAMQRLEPIMTNSRRIWKFTSMIRKTKKMVYKKTDRKEN